MRVVEVSLEPPTMPTLNFFQQARQDGGMRTGIEINCNALFERFAEGPGEYDPTLTWFVDVEIQGDALPDRPEDVRRWFVEHSEEIRRALLCLADELRAGVDVDVWPLRKVVISEAQGRGYHALVTCSAMRRFEGQHLADQLRNIADRWEEHIQSLPAVEEVRL